jgi:hypothetical protein
MKDNKLNLSILQSGSGRRLWVESEIAGEAFTKNTVVPSGSKELARKTPYRKLFANTPDLSRKCGQRNAVLAK